MMVMFSHEWTNNTDLDSEPVETRYGVDKLSLHAESLLQIFQPIHSLLTSNYMISFSSR